MRFLDVQLVGSPVKPMVKQAWERCSNACEECQFSVRAEFVVCLLPRMLTQVWDVIVLFVGSIYGASVLRIWWLPRLCHFVISLDAFQQNTERANTGFKWTPQHILALDEDAALLVKVLTVLPHRAQGNFGWSPTRRWAAGVQPPLTGCRRAAGSQAQRGAGLKQPSQNHVGTAQATGC